MTPLSSDDTGPQPSLYDPRAEHDACGVGFVARLSGAADHALLEYAVMALARLAHRGGRADDGAGLLLPLPKTFLRRVWEPLCGPLPARFGLGHFFLPRDSGLRARVEQLAEKIATEHGLCPAAWRDTPTRPEILRPESAARMPVIRQALIRPAGLENFDDDEFERLLYVVRRHLEQAARAEGCGPDDFHVLGLSGRTVVYKGMLPGGSLAAFYPDLAERDFSAHFAVFHERYSTNTLPRWSLAQPFRCLSHNGEINTLPGNRAHMRLREPLAASPLFGPDMRHITPVLDPEGSDSAMLDNALELLLRGGRDLAHSAMMLLPEPFGASLIMGEDKRAFYEYHAALMEPWDGPAALVFTDGKRLGAMLDRNALRPCRFVVTTDGLVVLASEEGVLDIAADRVADRGRLRPRRMLMVDFARRRLVSDAECKGRVIYAKPYRRWVREYGLSLRDLPVPAGSAGPERALGPEELLRGQHLFGYAKEEIEDILLPMGRDAQEPICSMGLDTPLAVLSRRPQLLFSYLKQCFAQVTNPPIDPLREGLVMSLAGFAGRRGNILEETPEHYALLRLANPVLLPEDLARLRASTHPRAVVHELPMLFPLPEPGQNPGQCLEAALEGLFAQAEAALDAGATLLLLSDAAADAHHAPLPSLLAVSALHHHLLRQGRRHACGLIVDTGEAREVMHAAQLIAFGAAGVHPRLAFACLDDLAGAGRLDAKMDCRAARRSYVVALQKGLLKTFSRMGISTLRSFQAGQGFEALGLGRELLERHFTGLPGRIGGVGLAEIAAESLARHAKAFPEAHAKAFPEAPTRPAEALPALTDTGRHRQRAGGEKHLWSPVAIRALHQAVREDDLQSYRRYAEESDHQEGNPVTLRALLDLVPCPEGSIPLEEVEPEAALLQRFVGAAMSYGSISPEAHAAVAAAFNAAGGRSNCGEGGEAPERLQPGANGEDLRSRVRQIASGRFGVTAAYLVNAEEIQIKMAQGAKPGEGGQLPAHKVRAEIARVRRTTPGVTLISPPPHHDIYSIEDLAQLIFDLKRLNPRAAVSVKLTACAGVGTVACGVAKAGADGILISGHDGGTGASPRTAVSHVGLPWEMGLAEAHAALTANHLRGRVRLQADGQLRTGRDLAVAALLGAEEFGLGTAVLVALGCCLLRVCHLGTCPVGVAAQDEKLRAKFSGTPEHLERFLRFLARDLREHMAALGFRRLDEMVGRADCLRFNPPAAPENALAVSANTSAIPGLADNEVLWRDKVAGLDLSGLLAPAGPVCRQPAPVDTLADSPLEGAMLDKLLPAVRTGRAARFSARVHNTDRAVCTRLSGEIARLYGDRGLPPGLIEVSLRGTAGQSAGAFLSRGVRLTVRGAANDYVGKGLSGGVVAVMPEDKTSPSNGPAVLGENAAVGNVALYGAVAGELYVAGTAGERFAVRNSGANAVVEGVGDHACEYMTGGVVVVLGETGCNFAAGMSGGYAFVFDRSEHFLTRCNLDGVELEGVWRSEDAALLRRLLENHVRHTGSPLAAALLRDWDAALPLFLKVTPLEYRRALARMKSSESAGAEDVAATEEVYHP